MLSQIYFGIRPAGRGGGDMFSNLLSGLFGGSGGSASGPPAARGRGRGTTARISPAALD